jgi:hypothetical protein
LCLSHAKEASIWLNKNTVYTCSSSNIITDGFYYPTGIVGINIAGLYIPQALGKAPQTNFNDSSGE